MVSVEDMRSKLLTKESVLEILETTEPLSSVGIEESGVAKFRLSPEFFKDSDTQDSSKSWISVGGKESEITKEAVFQAASAYSLTPSYMSKIPVALGEKLLNYHYGEGFQDKAQKLLKVEDKAVAFTSKTITPFSNVQLLESVLSGLKLAGYTEALFDYKFSHSLTRTNFRIILPDAPHTITSDMVDVPKGASDVWYPGIQVSNSLTAKTQTSIEPYLFRWWCTNGATFEYDFAAWSRRTEGQSSEVYEWAEQQVEEISAKYEGLFAQVQALNEVDITETAAEVIRQIFEELNVPVTQRNQIIETLLAQTPITLYSLMQAITQTANDKTLSPERVDRLLRIGGAFPKTVFDGTKARIWSEGHSASAHSKNPYALARAV